MDIQKTLKEGTLKEKRSLFAFTIQDADEVVAFKYNLWCRYFFPKYFTSKDAPFHKEADINRIRAYKGAVSQYVDIAFRGASKTSRTKLFIAFCILNDLDHHRRYYRVLSADIDNAKQSITDIYNMLVVERVAQMYPETFVKTTAKREETMGSFTTATGIKAISTQIGVDQRGNIMEDAKADFDWYDDIETKTTIRSAKKTKSIGENMEEARTGLALGGSSIYTCNYFSELGNVHNLVTKPSSSKVVQIVPILNEQGESNWPARYSIEDIAQMKQDDEDFEGERMCRPSASRDILFDRETLEAMPALIPEREIAGFKIFKKFNASHRYASGHDVAGGVGLDSSTSVFIDFETIPAQVVATFANNMVKPDDFGHEIVRQADHYGDCLVAPERNNHGHATIAILKQLGANIFKTQGKDSKIQNQITTEYGWLTTGITKPKMLFGLAKAVEDGLIQLNDKDLINEAKSYSRNDLLDSENDPRLVTRHFDLLIACAIAYQMKDFAEYPSAREDTSDDFVPEEPMYAHIGI